MFYSAHPLRNSSGPGNLKRPAFTEIARCTVSAVAAVRPVMSELHELRTGQITRRKMDTRRTNRKQLLQTDLVFTPRSFPWEFSQVANTDNGSDVIKSTCL